MSDEIQLNYHTTDFINQVRGLGSFEAKSPEHNEKIKELYNGFFDDEVYHRKSLHEALTGNGWNMTMVMIARELKNARDMELIRPDEFNMMSGVIARFREMAESETRTWSLVVDSDDE